MTETLNFGPEWLRALSTGGGGGGAGTHQFKMAEHRYGREEMLALFSKTDKLPPELAEFQSILRKECQSPLTLSPLSEEERWSFSQSVNSAMAIRATGRGAGGPQQASGRGRGVSRGRGRGRVEYKRSMTYEEDTAFPRREYNRTMSWEESNENRYEKGHRSERGFEEEGSGSPRKVIERERGSTSENWRSPRGERLPSRYEEEDSGWRRAVPRQRLSSREGEDNWRTSGSQAPSRTSWHSRERDRTNSQTEFEHDRDRERDRERDRDGLRDGDRDKSPRERERHYSGRGRYNSQPEEEEMPAWSNLDDAFDEDEIGVFDSSGAFTAVKKSDFEKEEKEKEEKEKAKKVAETDTKEDGGSPEAATDPPPESKKSEDVKEDAKSQKEEKPSSPKDNNVINVQSNLNLSKTTENSSEKIFAAKTEPAVKVRTEILSSTVPVTESVRTEQTPVVETKLPNTEVETPSSSTSSNSLLSSNLASNVLLAQSPVSSEADGVSQLIPGGVVNIGTTGEPQGIGVTPATEDPSKVEDEEDQLQHLEKAAENLMAELDEDEKLADEMNSQTESQLIPTPKIATEEEPLPRALPATHEDAHKWFYKDPQNQVQGPFRSSEMLEWFRAGYFNLNLQVKQGMDETFQPLGTLIKRWGKVPFISSPPPSSPIPPQMLNPTPTPQAPPVAPQPVAPQMSPLTPSGPPISQLPEHWSKIAQVTLLAQKKQQQILQQQQQQQAFQTLLQQQQSLIRVQASRIYQELIQRGKTLTLSQQQVLRQQLVALQQQHQLLLQQQQNWARVQQTLSITSVSHPPSLGGIPQGKMTKPSAMMMKDPQGGGNADEMQISVWDPVPTEKSRSEWSIGVWDPEMAKDITEEDRIKQAHEEALRRKLEEEQEKILRGQEEKIREEERRKIEELQAKRIEEELKRAQEDQRIMEEIRKQNEMKLKELEAEHKELQAKFSNQPVVGERKSPVEQIKTPEETSQQDELKKLEELHQQQKEQEEQIKQQQEGEKRTPEEDSKLQEEILRKAKELERATREQEERKRETEKQEQLIRQQQENQRQQQEVIRRMQQQQQQQQQAPPKTSQPQAPQTSAPQSTQANNFSLPSSAMWGQQRTIAPPVTTTSAPTLAQIQQIQQQQEERERQDRQRQLQLLQQQQQQQQQQQAQARSVGWASSQSRSAPTSGPKSLREIQEEQARQQLERQRQQSKAAPNIPMATTPVSAGAWGSGSSAGNSSHMAWGSNSATWNRDHGPRSSPNTTSSGTMGFWDDAQDAIARTSGTSNNSNYPPLRSSVAGSNQRQPTNPNMKSRIAKEAENVQRLFQGKVRTDEFSQWCEMALQSMGASVDIPTFVTFLQEVESPYEVHEYVKTYLGDSGESSDFARKFLERRARHKEHQRKQNEQMNAWMVQQVKSTASGMPLMGQGINTTASINDSNKRKDQKGRKRQLVDPSILGFSVGAAERVNMGEIQTIEDS